MKKLRTAYSWLLLVVLMAAVVAHGQQPSTANGEWPHYTADEKGTRYSPLAQIDAANFNNLEAAWRFKPDNLGTRPEFKLEGTPIMVGGKLYTTAGTRRAVVRLDGKTGELDWVYSVREGLRAAISPRQLSGRGVSYWTDGRGDDRVLFVTMGYRLVALNAHTGRPIPGFGADGMVDLKVGMVRGENEQIDLETGEAGLHATPLVVNDVVIVGSAFKEGMTVQTHNNTKGLVRAYNVRTGELLWTFHTIPRPGEFGHETWENGSWATNGNTGVWTQMTVDAELGLVYLPVESPSSDFYGGHRPGDNLFAESLVCVNVKTGERVWHFQIVHHPIWDHDLSSAPILADIRVNGRDIKAVALPTKQSYLYVFDRITGEPVWPIEERPVPQSTVPGEKTSPTQPFPTKPPAYAKNYVAVPDDLIDFTPQLRAEAVAAVAAYKHGPLYNPPVVANAEFIGAMQLGNAAGGTNWPGAAYDPETHTVYAQASQSSLFPISLRTPPAGYSDIKYVMGRDGTPFRISDGPGYGSAADYVPEPPPVFDASNEPKIDYPEGDTRVQGLPVVKPPYGVISAINLDRGEIDWQVPFGDTPDAVRNHPALRGLDIGNTGQPGSVGPLVTKTLVILGDAQVTTTDEHPRGAMLRAYDKATGKQVGAVYMPAQLSGSPMTYMVDGRQYIVVAVSGGAYAGEYIAYALPTN